MPIGLALGLASLVASGYGMYKNAKANKTADQQLANRQSELDSWYNKEYNMNYLDTEESKSTIKLLQNQMKEAMKKVDQNNAIRGASDEARVATADKLNTRLNDAVTKLAGYGTQYRDSIRREYQGLKGNLDNLQYQNLLGKSQNWANFSNNAMNTFGTAMEANSTGAFDPDEDTTKYGTGYLKDIMKKWKLGEKTDKSYKAADIIAN